MVEKLEISIGQTIMILEKEMRTNENAKQTFLQHLPVPVQQINQVFDDFEILMHTSKGYQINFKFLFIQFGLKR